MYCVPAVVRLLVVLPCVRSSPVVRWGIHLDVSWEVTWLNHVSSVSGDVGDLECQTIPIGLKPYPSETLNVAARTGYESLGGQHLLVAAIPWLSQERCCEATRADFSVAWLPPASPLPSFSARMCLGKGWASRETVTLASICPSWTCHFPSRIRVTSLSIVSWHSPPVAYLVALSTTRRPHCII